MRYILGLALSGIVCTGCTTVSNEKFAQDVNQAWSGVHVKELVNNYGMPTDKLDLADGTSMYTWVIHEGEKKQECSQDFSFFGVITGTPSGSFTCTDTTSSPTCKVTATADRSDRIISVNASNCEHYEIAGEDVW